MITMQKYFEKKVIDQIQPSTDHKSIKYSLFSQSYRALMACILGLFHWARSAFVPLLALVMFEFHATEAAFELGCGVMGQQVLSQQPDGGEISVTSITCVSAWLIGTTMSRETLLGPNLFVAIITGVWLHLQVPSHVRRQFGRLEENFITVVTLVTTLGVHSHVSVQRLFVLVTSSTLCAYMVVFTWLDGGAAGSRKARG